MLTGREGSRPRPGPEEQPRTKAEDNTPGCYSPVAIVKIKAQTVTALP